MRQLKQLTILFLLIISALRPATADGPALWSMGDEDTTIYLFGTVHALEKGLAWGTPAIKTAFDASEALILEVDEAELMRAGPMIARAGRLPGGQTLESVLGEGLYSDVMRHSNAVGLPRHAFRQARPWFASLSVGVVAMVKAGYDPNAGADKALTQMAKEKGKPVYGLETAEIQVAIFSKMDEGEERTFLIETLKQLSDLKSHFQAMQTAWLRGDTASLDQLVNGAMQSTPQLYERALVSRNRNWSRFLKARLETPGVFFVAVGAGHLVGRDSVQSQLATEGIVVTRLN